VAWDAVSGTAFVRRQKMFGKVARMGREGAVSGDSELLGLDLTDTQIQNGKRLDAPAVDDPRVTVRRPTPGSGRQLGFDTYQAEVPLAEIDALVAGCLRGDEQAVTVQEGPELSSASFGPALSGVTETFERIGPQHLHAVLTRPAPETRDQGTWVVFTAQGVERASGPGNLWTILARELAQEGITSLRADRRGVGWHTDPDMARQPNPFGLDTIDDVAETARVARSRGARRVVVVGSCAGAWLAVAAALRARVDAVLALGMPSWTSHPEPLDTTFLDFWHGVAAPIDSEPSRRQDNRARADTWLAARPRLNDPLARLRLRWGLTKRSVRFRSTGLPGLWSLPKQTTCHVVLAGGDVRFYTASGGHLAVPVMKALGRRVRVDEVEHMDHALRSSFARAYVRTALRGLLGLGPTSAGAEPNTAAVSD